MDQVPHAVLGDPDKQSIPTEQWWEDSEGDRCLFWRLCMWVTIITKRENKKKD